VAYQFGKKIRALELKPLMAITSYRRTADIARTDVDTPSCANRTESRTSKRSGPADHYAPICRLMLGLEQFGDHQRRGERTKIQLEAMPMSFVVESATILGK
jgi:hypothetical protein